jgi:LmbE family N-acetylglucosaminyl deacetylase
MAAAANTRQRAADKKKRTNVSMAADVRIDAAIRGTDELHWQTLLAAAPLWAPADGPLLIVSPHPDNEVLAAGGLIHAWRQAGRKVTILSLTDGETAYPQWNRLARVRREELKEALQILSPSPLLIVRLGIPDGRIAECAGKLRGAIASLITPGTTIVAPYENDGPPDHNAAGRTSCDVARDLGLPVARYPIWTWHHGNPPALSSLPWRRFSLSEAAQAAKAEAVTCFTSQTSPYKRKPIFPDHIVRYFTRPYETFLV